MVLKHYFSATADLGCFSRVLFTCAWRRFPMRTSRSTKPFPVGGNDRLLGVAYGVVQPALALYRLGNHDAHLHALQHPSTPVSKLVNDHYGR